MRYLLDADTISFFVRRHPTVLERLKATPPELVAVSSITAMEIEFGLQRKPERRASVEPIVAALFEAVEVLPYGLAEARATAAVRAALERQGQPIGVYDVLVAGTALANGLIVVSGNVREYRRVAGLAAEDWREPEV